MTARAKSSADDSAPMTARPVRRPAGQRIDVHPDAPADGYASLLRALPYPAALIHQPAGTIEILAKNQEFSQFFQEIEGTLPAVERRAIRQFDWRERAETMFQSHRPSDRFEIEFQGQLGARVYSCSLTWVEGHDESESLLLLAATDRTSERKAESTLRKELLTDSLTSLPNRIGFVEQIELQLDDP